jgi:hypothetical protein
MSIARIINKLLVALLVASPRFSHQVRQPAFAAIDRSLVSGLSIAPRLFADTDGHSTDCLEILEATTRNLISLRCRTLAIARHDNVIGNNARWFLAGNGALASPMLHASLEQRRGGKSATTKVDHLGGGAGRGGRAKRGGAYLNQTGGALGRRQLLSCERIRRVERTSLAGGGGCIRGVHACVRACTREKEGSSG